MVKIFTIHPTTRSKSTSFIVSPFPWKFDRHQNKRRTNHFDHFLLKINKTIQFNVESHMQFMIAAICFCREQKICCTKDNSVGFQFTQIRGVHTMIIVKNCSQNRNLRTISVRDGNDWCNLMTLSQRFTLTISAKAL